MALKTKTVQKVVKAPKTKGATKSKGAEKTVKVFAAILSAILGGDFGQAERRFYLSGFDYHADKKTAFPRTRADGTRKYAPVDGESLIARMQAQAKAGTAQDNAFSWSRGSFDDMVLETFGAQVPKDWAAVLGPLGPKPGERY